MIIISDVLFEKLKEHMDFPEETSEVTIYLKVGEPVRIECWSYLNDISFAKFFSEYKLVQK